MIGMLIYKEKRARAKEDILKGEAVSKFQIVYFTFKVFFNFKFSFGIVTFGEKVQAAHMYDV